MRFVYLVGAIGIAMSAGCAATGPSGEGRQIDFALKDATESAQMHVGRAHVIEGRVDPRQPVQVSAKDGTIAVSFAQRGSAGTRMVLDSTSFAALSAEPQVFTNPPSLRYVERLSLEEGRYLLCWTEGDLETGRHAVAQSFEADGAPRGKPVVISPSDADVLVAPAAVRTDAQHVVAFFPAAVGDAFELMAVPIDGH